MLAKPVACVDAPYKQCVHVCECGRVCVSVSREAAEFVLVRAGVGRGLGVGRYQGLPAKLAMGQGGLSEPWAQGDPVW